jgi:hypothetical protein
MYDVIYIDAHGAESCIARHLADRADAAELAKRVAAERDAGRMMLAGSAKQPNCVCVVHTETLREAA